MIASAIYHNKHCNNQKTATFYCKLTTKEYVEEKKCSAHIGVIEVVKE